MNEKQMLEEMLQKQGVEIRKARSEKIKLQKEVKEYKRKVEKVMTFIDIVEETIKRQPTGCDEWILNKLYSIKNILIKDE